MEWAIRSAAYIVLIRCLDEAIQLNWSEFVRWIAVNLTAWGAYFLICTIRELLQAQTIRKMNNQIRRDLSLSILHREYSDFRSHDSGEYLSWMTNNIKQIEALAWLPFFGSVEQAAQVIWCGLALLTLHWSFPILSLLIAFVMWIVPKLFERKMERLGVNCNLQQASAVGSLKELIQGRQIFLMFQKETLFEKKTDTASDQIEKSGYDLKRLQSIANSLLGYLNVSAQLVTNILVVFLTSRGIINIAVFAGAGNLTGGVAGGLDCLAKNRLSLSASKTYFSQITKHEETAASKAKKTWPAVFESLSMEDVSFGFFETPVLNKINLCFRRGGKYALTGSSGCGKTTLLKLLMGEYRGYSGTIRIDGTDIREIESMEIRRQICLIEQDVSLFNATIRENITLGEEFSEDQMKRTIADSALVNDLNTMQNGLDTMVGENGCNLSGGQKQRVAIARALIHNRSILLVDEGTSALDDKNAEMIENCLLNKPDLTLILVSHQLTPARKAQFTCVYDLTSGSCSSC